MRRFLGLSFLLGAFACAGTADHSYDDTAAVEPSATPRPIRAVLGGTLRAAPEATTGGASAQTTTTAACSSNVTLHGSGGAVIAQPSVTMLFWGSYWTTTGDGERQQYTTAWSTLARDPAFYARLAEYSTPVATIGAGSWGGATTGDASLASGALITEVQIEQEIAAEIAAGTAARLASNRIYVVMLPPGVTSQLDHDNNFAGHHAQFTPAGTTVPVRYAVITYSSDAGYTNPVVSHEIAEATTDADVSTGWYDQFGMEISDLCRFDYAPLDGFSVEKTWSVRACACVGPEGGDVTDAGVPDVVVTPACTAPTWSASATYTGGQTVSFAGRQYTAAYWNQNDEPDTHSGPSGSGQPWGPPAACSTTTTCTPSCGGKQCGDDGCGGQCGTCDAASQVCNASGQCVAWCVPSCNLKQCGSDGCGGSCGQCGAGLACNPNNQCVPPTTTSSCSGITPWSASEPWYAYAVGEQHTGSDGHRYACKNVAYCIDDPTSSVGATYGWTDLGPC